MFAVCLKYVPEYCVPLFTMYARRASSAALEIIYGLEDVPPPLQDDVE